MTENAAPENRQETRTINPSEATRFQPGISGNPGGRPKKAPITAYLKAQLEEVVPTPVLDRLKPLDRSIVTEVLGASPTFGQFVAFRTIQQALKGDVYALREVLDRVEGKVVQKMNVGNENGGPLVFKVERSR